MYSQRVGSKNLNKNASRPHYTADLSERLENYSIKKNKNSSGRKEMLFDERHFRGGIGLD
jgi:hypothetical protein